MVLCDSSGTISVTCVGDNHMFSSMMLVGGGGGGGYNFGCVSGGTFTQINKSVQNAIQSTKDYVTCDDEQLVFERLNSDGFAFYNGVVVVKTGFDTSFSYGFIGLSANQQNVDTLKHEYGHAKQFQDKGVLKFTGEVAIPSLLINILSRQDKLPYDYYSYPFEAEANKLAGIYLTDGKRPTLPQGGYSSIWDLIVLFFN